jgi:uncharacterized protein (DUF58 family)
VGAVVFDDSGCVAHRPHRSRGQVQRILETIVARNQALRAESEVAPAPGMLNQALRQAAALAGHDHAILIASDLDGADDETRGLVASLSQHNDVVVLLVHDPSAKQLPAQGRYVVTGGELQVQLDVGRGDERQALLGIAGDRVRPILEWTRELGVPVLPLSTAEETATQLPRLLGVTGRPRRG